MMVADGMENAFEVLEQRMLGLNNFGFKRKNLGENSKPLAFSSRPLLEQKKRHLQVAFNYDTGTVRNILPRIPKNDRIIIEAGTPFIKKNGSEGIRLIRSLWSGLVVADLKIMDGALGEVDEALNAGADAVTVAGAAPTETIKLVVSECRQRRAISMVDMINVENPLKVLLKARVTPDVVVLHRGRDEENVYGKVIEYKQVKKIKSKFNSMISAAGGVDLKEAQSAAFNGANIVVVNLVHPSDKWKGISTNDDIAKIAHEFLRTIE